MHSFLLQQQRLRRITSAALVLESAPEAFLLDVQQHLRPLLACLRELGLSQASSCRLSLSCAALRLVYLPQVSSQCASICSAHVAAHPPSLQPSFTLQEQTTAVFRGMRRQRAQAARFLALGPEELERRWYWLCRNLGLEGPPAAAYLASAPSLLLADPADAATVVRWLHCAAGWRRLALRRNLQRSPVLLLTPVAQLEAAATFLQHQLDASVDELCLLLSVAPRLLALAPAQLAEAVATYPSSWQLAAHWMERPPLLMREAAVSSVAGLALVQRLHCIASRQVVVVVQVNHALPCTSQSTVLHEVSLPHSPPMSRRRCTCRWPRWPSCTALAGAGSRWPTSYATTPRCCAAYGWSKQALDKFGPVGSYHEGPLTASHLQASSLPHIHIICPQQC